MVINSSAIHVGGDCDIAQLGQAAYPVSHHLAEAKPSMHDHHCRMRPGFFRYRHLTYQLNAIMIKGYRVQFCHVSVAVFRCCIGLDLSYRLLQCHARIHSGFT
ncbi:MAG TPA: hypothetical protein VGO18_39360, partial [Steroidobacteraceae bacterium]|nr:hypothetical protein [Steroidobacteraceae bacterium]